MSACVKPTSVLIIIIIASPVEKLLYIYRGRVNDDGIFFRDSGRKIF